MAVAGPRRHYEVDIARTRIPAVTDEVRLAKPVPGNEPGPRPRDEELDFFGLTDPGRVRKENQDHFLICTVHRQVVIHATSRSDADHLPLRGQRLASIMLVADGVGGRAGGQEASHLAVETITRYVSSTMRSFVSGGESAEASQQAFLETLRTAALAAHPPVGAAAAAPPSAH